MIDVTGKMIDRFLAVLHSLRHTHRPESLSTPAGEETWRSRRTLLTQSLNKQADDLLDFDNEPPPDTQPAGRRA